MYFPVIIGSTASAAPIGFPATVVLDRFDDGDATSDTWYRLIADENLPDEEQLTIGQPSRLYWVDQIFGQDQEAFFTIDTFPTGNAPISLTLKAQDTLGNNQLEVRYNPDAEEVVVWSTWSDIISETTDITTTVHGSAIPITYEVGDQFGARATRDGQVTLFKNGDAIGERDVSAWPLYANAGYIGLRLSQDGSIDDFGGGTYAPLELTVSASKHNVIEGETITQTLTVHTAGELGLTNVMVANPIPDGLTYITDSASHGGVCENGALSWSLGGMAADVTATLTYRVTVDALGSPQFITNTASATATQLLYEVEGELILSAGVVTTASVSSVGDTLLSSDERLTITVPADVFTQTTPVTITTFPSQQSVTDVTAGVIALVRYNIEAGGPITFTNPVTLTFDVSDLFMIDPVSPTHEVVAGFLEEFDDQGQALTETTWSLLGFGEYVTDTLISVQTNHFSQWGAFSIPGEPNGPSKPAPRLPGVDLFGGALTFAYPFAIAPGRNGLQPDLSLIYSSRGADSNGPPGDNPLTGIGWSLSGMPQITRKIINSIDSYPTCNEAYGSLHCFYQIRFAYENVFWLSLNGQSHRLIPDATKPGLYHTESETFLRVLRCDRFTDASFGAYCGYVANEGDIPNGTKQFWEVTTKDGALHRLGYTGDAEQVVAMGPYRQHKYEYQRTFEQWAGTLDRHVASRWRLDLVVDPHGNAMQYQYSKKSGDSRHGGYDASSYLERVLYGNQTPLAKTYTGASQAGWRAKVELDYIEQKCEACESGFATGESDRLHLVTAYIKEGVNDNFEIVRQYALDVRNHWFANYRQGSYLNAITERGKDAGGPALQSLFEYKTLPNRSRGHLPFPDRYNLDPFDNWRMVSLSGPNGLKATVGYAGEPLRYYEWRYYAVSQLTLNAGLGNPVVRNYTPSGQHFIDEPHMPGSIALGFASNVETIESADGQALSRSRTYFHLDRERRGRAYLTQALLPSNNNVLQQSYNDWEIVASPQAPGLSAVRFIKLNETHNGLFDGPQPLTTTVQYTYDDYGNVLSQKNLGGDGSSDNRTTWNTYTYNTTKWIVDRVATQRLYAGAPGSEPNPNTALAQTLNFYDGATSTSATPNPGLLTTSLTGITHTVAVSMAYGPLWGLPVVITDARGFTTTIGYDVWGQYPLTVTNTLGQRLSLSYAPHWGALTAQTDPNGATTQYAYDNHGRLLKIAQPGDSLGSPTVEYGYDDNFQSGGLTLFRLHTASREVSGQAGLLESYEFYNGLGQLVQTRSESPTGSGAAVGMQWYDARGLVVSQTLPYHSTDALGAFEPGVAGVVAGYSRTAYDALGRATIITGADGTTATTSYAGYTTTAIDGLGRKRQSTLDSLGQLTQVVEYTGTYAAATVYATTVYTYDLRGNLLGVRDALGHSTAITYDDLGRKTGMFDPDMGVWTYAYDAAGNIIEQNDARGQSTLFGYDRLGRLITKTYQSPDRPTSPVTYTYDLGTHGVGRLSSVQDGSGGQVFRYGLRGPLISQTRQINGVPWDYSVLYAYDNLGRATTLTYPDGEVVTTTYNSAGLPLGLRSTTYAEDYVSGTTYNANGQILTRNLGNGLTTSYSYFPLNFQLQSIQSGPSGSIQNLSYRYDRIGNVLAITDTASLPSQQVQSFDYDPLDRLNSAYTSNDASGAYNLAYAYGQSGNILKVNNATYHYSDTAHIHAVTQIITNGVALTYTYDANGNMLQRVELSGTQRITYTQGWDAENRLTTVTNTVTGDVTRFVYDGDGARVAQIAPDGKTTVYVGELYEEMLPAGIGVGEQSGGGSLPTFGSYQDDPVRAGSVEHYSDADGGSAATLNLLRTEHRLANSTTHVDRVERFVEPASQLLQSPYTFTDNFNSLDQNYWSSSALNGATLQANNGELEARRGLYTDTNWLGTASISSRQKVSFLGQGSRVEWRFRVNTEARWNLVYGEVHDIDAERYVAFDCGVTGANNPTQYGWKVYCTTRFHVDGASTDYALHGFYPGGADDARGDYFTVKVVNPSVRTLVYHLNDTPIFTKTFSVSEWNGFDWGTVRWVAFGWSTVEPPTNDGSGNIINADLDRITITNYDSSAPSIILSGQPAGAWFNGNPAITYQINDGGSGPRCILVNWASPPVNDGSCFTISGSTSMSPLTGTQTLYIRGWDWTGNPISTTAVYKRDVVSPTSQVTNTPTFTNTSWNVGASASDAGGSGVAGVKLFFRKGTSGSWTQYQSEDTDAPYQWTFTPPLGEGRYQFCTQARDWASNVDSLCSVGASSQEKETIYDITPAHVSDFRLNDGYSWTNNLQIALDLAAIDPISSGVASGLATVRFRNEGGNWSVWESYTSSKMWTLNNVDDLQTVYLQVGDSAGNITTTFNTITLDRQPPTLTIALPANEIHLGQARLIVRGATNSSTHLSALDIYIEPARIVHPSLGFVAANGFYTRTLGEVDLEIGNNTLIVTATDHAFNQTVVTRTIYYDPLGPQVIDLEPFGTTRQSSPSVSARFHISGTAGIDLASVLIVVGGVNVTAQSIITSGGFLYSPMQTLSGTVPIYVQVADAVGHVGRANWSFSIDTSTWLQVEYPLPQHVLNTFSTDVRGLAEPGAQITLTVNGSLADAAIVTPEQHFDFESVSLQNGNNQLMLIATDPIGNQASTTLTVTVDTAMPSAQVQAEPSIFSPGNCLPQTTFVQTALAPPGYGLASWQLNVLDADAAVVLTQSGSGMPPHTLVWNGVGLPENAYTYTLMVTATNGNVTRTPPQMLHIDHTPAAAPSIDTPSSGITLTTWQVWFAGRAEPGSTITLLDGGSFTKTLTQTVGLDGVWGMYFPLHGGVNRVYAVADDATCATSPASDLVTLTQVVRPPLHTVGITPTTAAAGSAIKIWASSRHIDPLNGAATLGVWADPPQTNRHALTRIATSNNNTLGWWAIEWNIPGDLASDDYPVFFEGIDEDNLSGAGETALAVRNTPTPPKLIWPDASFYTSHPNLRLNGSVDQSYVTVQVSDDDLNILGKQTLAGLLLWQVPLTLTADGAYALRVRAVDRFGQTSASSKLITVTLDMTPPKAMLNPLRPYINTMCINLSWQGDDGFGSGVHTYDVQRHNTVAWTTLLANVLETQTQYCPIEGVHGFRVRARDRLGNEGSWPTQAQTSVTVDRTAPQVALVINEHSPYAHVVGQTVYYNPTNSGVFSVTAIITDALAGLDKTIFPAITSTGASLPLNGESAITLEHAYGFTPASVSSGSYAVTVIDRATNMTQAGFLLVRDSIAPSMSVAAPAQTSNAGITVSWNALDIGSGTTGLYTVAVITDTSAPAIWLANTSLTQATFTGESGHSYTFVVTATDHVGNVRQSSAMTHAVHVTKYYYLGASRVAMRQSAASGDGKVSYLHSDHLGTASAVTDDNGAEIARTLNLPFGATRWESGDSPTDFGFTGQKLDATGLMYFKARYYAPGIGRFVSADTVVPEPSNSQAWNRYSYVTNNPLKYNDPTGHCQTTGGFVISPEGDFDLGVAILGALGICPGDEDLGLYDIGDDHDGSEPQLLEAGEVVGVDPRLHDIGNDLPGFDFVLPEMGEDIPSVVPNQVSMMTLMSKGDSDDDEQRETPGINCGGIDINGCADVGGDLVGRDKIRNGQGQGEDPPGTITGGEHGKIICGDLCIGGDLRGGNGGILVCGSACVGGDVVGEKGGITICGNFCVGGDVIGRFRIYNPYPGEA